MICFMQYSCKCNNMAVACPQEVICDLLISFLKLYFGQIAAVSCKPDYLTSRLATFFFHNTAASASISNIYSKDTWRQSMNLEFIMIGQLVIVKVTLPICIISTTNGCKTVFLLKCNLWSLHAKEAYYSVYSWMQTQAYGLRIFSGKGIFKGNIWPTLLFKN